MNNSLPVQVRKYLEKYSYTRWILEWKKKEKISAAVVIPGIKEHENIKRLIESLLKNDFHYLQRSLLIFVINNLASSNSGIKNENIESIRYIRSLMKETMMNVGLVDAASEGIEMPEKEGGVGFARKIGMDLALTAFDYSEETKKIVLSLDADCIVEKNYLGEIFNFFENSSSGAAVLKYRHQLPLNAVESAAIVFYEIFLRYYVLGLRFARSPYAFHTIGSAFACSCETYIKSEGMNKRKAAEDFYFLQKAAKNTGIGRINSTAVFPSSRASWRVPFGTGSKVSKFKPFSENYLLYNPVLFRILKDWLAVFGSKEISEPVQYLRAAEKISHGLFDFLTGQNFKKDFENILKNSVTDVQLEKQKINWFDGFRTLKLIHYLRDKEYPMINISEALDIFLDWAGIKDKPLPKDSIIPPLDIQKEYLEILRNLDET